MPAYVFLGEDDVENHASLFWAGRPVLLMQITRTLLLIASGVVAFVTTTAGRVCISPPPVPPLSPCVALHTLALDSFLSRTREVHASRRVWRVPASFCMWCPLHLRLRACLPHALTPALLCHAPQLYTLHWSLPLACLVMPCFILAYFPFVTMQLLSAVCSIEVRRGVCVCFFVSVCEYERSDVF